MDLLQNLNDAQKEAVTTTEGYVRVIAGAGTGKTRVLAHRFAYLVNYMGILPGNILCVTFTNKSANEMRQRIHRLTGDNDTGYINTFHGFCVSVLQEDSYSVSYPKSFLVMDNSDIDDILAIIYEERGLTLRDMTYSSARDMIEIRKIKEEPEYYMDLINMSLETIHRKYLDAVHPKDIIFYGYLYQQKKCFGLDYNDLIKFVLYIFRINEEIRVKWQTRLEYIMIDEFQDIDALQYELMETLCRLHRNLFVVGDPDQTIYTWRGADVRYLLDFDREFPGTTTIMMMENYRSTPEIIDVSNSLIDKNKLRIRKSLIPTLSSGDRVLYHHAMDPDLEADWISERILALKDLDIDFKDIAVLYRAHYVSRSLEEKFIRKKIPYFIYSGVQFFGRTEIKDVLSYLRMIVFKDDLSFGRVVNVPKRKIGKSRMEFIKTRAEETDMTFYEVLKENLEDPVFKGTKAHEFVELIEKFSKDYMEKSVSEVLSEIIHESAYEVMLRTMGSQERLDNLAELKQSVLDYETSCGEEATLERYLKSLALFTNSNTGDPGDKVRFMTVHSAKGLEFPHVFVAGLNEGIFPSRKVRTQEGMEEERRLAYVAMTRAEKTLSLSDAEGRAIDGSMRYPSRFIMDIDREYLRFTEPPREDLMNEAKKSIETSDRFLPEKEPEVIPVNSRIRHFLFGEGSILEVDLEKRAYLIKFDSLETTRNITFRVPLEVIE